MTAFLHPRNAPRLRAALLIPLLLGACVDSPVAPGAPESGAEAVLTRPGKKKSNPPAAPASPSSIEGLRLWVDPYSQAAQQVAAWRETRPADAAEIEKIANRPQAVWFGEWSGDIRSAVSNATSTITAAGALPVYVAYNVPARDCGSYSAGGANHPDAYRAWIRGFADGLAGRLAVVVLEPDALAGITCLDAARQQERYTLLSEAVSVLSAAGARVYLDIGHPRWLSVSAAASRLTSANVAGAAGFALNVSNFQTTADNIAYGDAIAAQVGGKRYVIDTSRNGSGPSADHAWCNPPGRTLGTDPSTRTGMALVDAYLWVKRPGESDGTCNGGPPAGQWWAEWALDIATRTLMQVAYGG